MQKKPRTEEMPMKNEYYGLYFADLAVNILTQVCVYQSKQSCLINKMTQICTLAIATQTQDKEYS